MKGTANSSLCRHFLKNLDDLIDFLEMSIGIKVDKLLTVTFTLNTDNEKLSCDFISDGELKRANIRDHEED